MPQAELQEILQAYPAFSYVVDFNGDVVAALTSWPLKVLSLNLSTKPALLASKALFSAVEP